MQRAIYEHRTYSNIEQKQRGNLVEEAELFAPEKMLFSNSGKTAGQRERERGVSKGAEVFIEGMGIGGASMRKKREVKCL